MLQLLAISHLNSVAKKDVQNAGHDLTGAEREKRKEKKKESERVVLGKNECCSLARAYSSADWHRGCLVGGSPGGLGSPHWHSILQGGHRLPPPDPSQRQSKRESRTQSFQ